MTTAAMGAVGRPLVGARTMLRTEATLMVRSPALIVWVAILPITAAVVLGAIPAVRAPSKDLDGASWFSVYQPILIMFSMVMLAVQVLPDVITRYREMGILKRLRTTPASPVTLLGVQMVLAFAIETVVMVVMVVVPAGFGASMPRNGVGFVIAYLFGTVCMLSIGLLLASSFANPKVAGAVGTVAFFVMQFFAGLWIPRTRMPDWMRHISDATPSGSAVGSLTRAVGGQWPELLHLGVLAAWAVVLGVIAVRTFRWE